MQCPAPVDELETVGRHPAGGAAPSASETAPAAPRATAATVPDVARRMPALTRAQRRPDGPRVGADSARTRRIRPRAAETAARIDAEAA